MIFFNCSTKEVVSFPKILLVLDSYHWSQQMLQQTAYLNWMTFNIPH